MSLFRLKSHPLCLHLFTSFLPCLSSCPFHPISALHLNSPAYNAREHTMVPHHLAIKAKLHCLISHTLTIPPCPSNQLNSSLASPTVNSLLQHTCPLTHSRLRGFAVTTSPTGCPFSPFTPFPLPPTHTYSEEPFPIFFPVDSLLSPRMRH